MPASMPTTSPPTPAFPYPPHPDPPPLAVEWNFPEPPVPSADGPDEFDALQVPVEMVFELGFEHLLDLVQDLAGQPEPVIELAPAGRHQSQDLQAVHRDRRPGLVVRTAGGAEHAAEQWGEP